MIDPINSIEGFSRDLQAAYLASGMGRGMAGEAAINWAFGNNDTAFSVARLDGQVVGISSYIKSEMRFGVERGTAFQAVDSFVAPAMRGRGLFTRLAQSYADHAQSRGADLVWGFPNDGAAPAWFGKLGWASHGQVPFLIKPLRSGYFLRKLRLGGDFALSTGRDQHLRPIGAFGDWADTLWDQFARDIGCATIRDSGFLNHRLFAGLQAQEYRVVADCDSQGGAIVATREAEKHGGRIAYVMEAMGGPTLRGVLHSELARLRDRGVELALAWAYPWSPSYSALRRCGFFPLPAGVRPIRIWFGGRAISALAQPAMDRVNWYLSYLDSDTV